jgi:hypothetical protein
MVLLELLLVVLVVGHKAFNILPWIKPKSQTSLDRNPKSTKGETSISEQKLINQREN